MDELPRFIGPEGGRQASGLGLRSARRIVHEGRRIKPGARPKAIYQPSKLSLDAFPMYALEDTESDAARADTPA